MGWSNYIVIPDLKIKVEITRHFKEDEVFYNKIDNLRESLEPLQDKDSLRKNLKELNLLDINNILNCVKYINSINWEYPDINGGIMFLKSYGIDFIIISENDVDFENKYKDYKEIKINYN